MGRNRKRQSRGANREQGLPSHKEESVSNGDRTDQFEASTSKSDLQHQSNSDPEGEEFASEECATSLTEKGDDNEYVDVLGNGLLLKKALNKGIGIETRPGHGDVVTISYKGWLEDGTLVENVSSQTLTLGDGDVIQALELSIPLAELEERFELISDSRFTYGSRGREPDIPGDCKIRYEVQVLAARDPPCYATMSNEERVDIANEKRERGNYYYRRGEYAFAVNSYNKALKILTAPRDDLQGSSTVTPSEDVNSLEIKLQNNLAVTQLQIQAYDAAIKSCDAVLRKDPSNYKALFRKGKALLEQGDADEAIPILEKVHNLIPKSAMAASELQRARAVQRRHQEQWSRAASRLYPNRNRGKQCQSNVAKFRRHVCTTRMLVIVSVVVFIFAVLCAWYVNQLPSLKPIKDWVSSLGFN